jgi:hypothetical protein
MSAPEPESPQGSRPLRSRGLSYRQRSLNPSDIERVEAKMQSLLVLVVVFFVFVVVVTWCSGVRTGCGRCEWHKGNASRSSRSRLAGRKCLFRIGGWGVGYGDQAFGEGTRKATHSTRQAAQGIRGWCSECELRYSRRRRDSPQSVGINDRVCSRWLECCDAIKKKGTEPSM